MFLMEPGSCLVILLVLVYRSSLPVSICAFRTQHLLLTFPVNFCAYNVFYKCDNREHCRAFYFRPSCRNLSLFCNLMENTNKQKADLYMDFKDLFLQNYNTVSIVNKEASQQKISS
ncbi:hypothetical protein ILYODFUR_013065 [Ilyodon furcidens]|uniref:Secreted protein n=1 Tax=Ilyodon furcidens TaxID=33524 RepID=A0ABV0USW5_9TELE